MPNPTSRSRQIRDILVVHLYRNSELGDTTKAHILRSLDREDLADELVRLLRPTQPLPDTLKGKALRVDIAMALGEDPEEKAGGYNASTYWAKELDRMRKEAVEWKGKVFRVDPSITFLMTLSERHPDPVPVSQLPRYYSNSSATFARRLARQRIVDFKESEGSVDPTVSLTQKGLSLVDIVSVFVKEYS